MARVCTICGKGRSVGHNVSHANNKTKRSWRPNLTTGSSQFRRSGQARVGLHGLYPFRPRPEGCIGTAVIAHH